MTDQPKRMKILLIGNANVGKTTFLTRHITGEFTTLYEPTMGCEVHPVPFATNHGEITLDVWDTAGQKRFAGLTEAYYMDTDACIAMFDVTNNESFGSLLCEDGWIEHFRAVCPGKPVILVGNKVDSPHRVVKLRRISDAIRNAHVVYYDVSAKSCYNFEKPFLAAVKSVLGADTIFTAQGDIA